MFKIIKTLFLHYFLPTTNQEQILECQTLE